MTLSRLRRPYEFRAVRSIFVHAIVLLGFVATAHAQLEPHCPALAATTPRDKAVAACDELVASHGNALNMWAAVMVRVARPEAPSMEDLARADVLAEAAVKLAPGEAWGYLAQLELARRWGDTELIAQRLAELERVAPADPRTLRARQLYRPEVASAVVAAWGLLILAGVGTLVHALRRRRPGLRPLLVAAAVLLLVPLVPGRAIASEGFVVDDADPTRGVPTVAEANARPLDFAYYLQELSARIDAARARSDREAVARYQRAVALAVPDDALPATQLCTTLESLGRHAEAIAACRDALGRPGVKHEDLVRFSELVLAQSAPPPAQLDDVLAAARQLMSASETREPGLRLACRAAHLRGDEKMMDACNGRSDGHPRAWLMGAGILAMLAGAVFLTRAARPVSTRRPAVGRGV